jgi:type III secretion protein T
MTSTAELFNTVVTSYGTYIIALLLSLPRVYAFLYISQLLSPAVIPGLPRNAVILVLAFFAVPINQQYAAGFEQSATTLALYFGKEAAIGVLLGYAASWIFWVVQAAGGLIDAQRGAAIAASVDPLRGEQASPLGNLFSRAFLTYMFASGGVLILLGILYKSYVIWPATKFVPIFSDAFPSLVLSLFDNAMRQTFVIAAPILALMFLAEFALAIISRFAPQIQVFILAMPIKSFLAGVVLVFFMPTLMDFAGRQIDISQRFVEKFYEILRTGEKISPPAGTPSEAPPRNER